VETGICWNCQQERTIKDGELRKCCRLEKSTYKGFVKALKIANQQVPKYEGDVGYQTWIACRSDNPS
jgi:hypothetical protein